jgi:outer membrane protein assembly factor BamE (lipoprotein component of BamABCDE complex)
MADIPPPPPPADTAPPEIKLGQTKDQVLAAFGQPTRMAKVGAKEILYYKDMKVTLTNGKVSNVE